MIDTAMSAASWVAILVTFGIAVVVPGPDTFLVLRLGVRDRTAALFAACGISLGNLLWTIASVLGLAAIMQTLPGALPIMQVLGSSVLTWMGIQSIRSGLHTIRTRNDATSTAAVENVTTRPFKLGLVTNLSNPKALLFFTALFSQLLPAHATVFDRTLIVIALTILGLAWFLVFALLTSSSGFQRWFSRATPFIDIAAGIVFLAVAGFVLVELLIAVL